jgi:hypothetical protein
MPSYVAVLKFNSNHDQTGRFAAGKSKGGTLRGKKTPKPKLGPVVKIK